MTVTVARYFDPSEAHVVRALLESAGLMATVADDHHVTANYPLSTALGGVRVQVPQDQLEAAREWVAAYASQRLAGHVPVADKLLAVAVFVFGAATFPSRDSLGECRDCGHTWHRQG